MILLPWRHNFGVSVGEAVKGQLLKVLGGERLVGLRQGGSLRCTNPFYGIADAESFSREAG